jgi:hypothetical protein
MKTAVLDEQCYRAAGHRFQDRRHVPNSNGFAVDSVGLCGFDGYLYSSSTRQSWQLAPRTMLACSVTAWTNSHRHASKTRRASPFVPAILAAASSIASFCNTLWSWSFSGCAINRDCTISTSEGLSYGWNSKLCRPVAGGVHQKTRDCARTWKLLT